MGRRGWEDDIDAPSEAVQEPLEDSEDNTICLNSSNSNIEEEFEQIKM